MQGKRKAAVSIVLVITVLVAILTAVVYMKDRVQTANVDDAISKMNKVKILNITNRGTGISVLRIWHLVKAIEEAEKVTFFHSNVSRILKNHSKKFLPAYRQWDKDYQEMMSMITVSLQTGNYDTMYKKKNEYIKKGRGLMTEIDLIFSELRAAGITIVDDRDKKKK